jgi:hypothetical protein
MSRSTASIQRPLDGVGGRLSRLRWCGHFIADLGLHNRAAFVAYRGSTKTCGEGHMRLIFGMIIGVSLTVGAAYIADVVGGPDAKPLVNWEVVGKNIDAVTALARAGWKRIAG